MKKLFLIISIFCLVFVGCEQETDTGIPQIKNVIITDMYENLISGIEKNTFTEGDRVYFGLTITDTGLDLDRVVISQKSESQNIAPIDIKIPNQIRETDFYYSSLNAEIPGTWTIEGYAVDKKGNKSNTVSKNVIVGALPTFSVTYDINGGSGTVPIDIKRYKSNETITAARSDGFYREGYTFIDWTITKLINGWKFGKNAGEQFTIDQLGGGTPSDITLSANWKPSIYNICHDKNGTNITLTWNIPEANNYIGTRISIWYVYSDGGSSPLSQSNDYWVSKPGTEFNFNFSLTGHTNHQLVALSINMASYLSLSTQTVIYDIVKLQYRIEL